MSGHTEIEVIPPRKHNSSLEAILSDYYSSHINQHADFKATTDLVSLQAVLLRFHLITVLQLAHAKMFLSVLSMKWEKLVKCVPTNYAKALSASRELQKGHLNFLQQVLCQICSSLLVCMIRIHYGSPTRIFGENGCSALRKIII